jgi:phosphorylase kinase alpha/beta subunit
MLRKQSDSVARLEYYYHLVKTAILAYQVSGYFISPRVAQDGHVTFPKHPVTGLLPATAGDQTDAWVRDNVYGVMAVWALALAYRKRAETDEGRARAYQMERVEMPSAVGVVFESSVFPLALERG